MGDTVNTVSMVDMVGRGVNVPILLGLMVGRGVHVPILLGSWSSQ